MNVLLGLGRDPAAWRLSGGHGSTPQCPGEACRELNGSENARSRCPFVKDKSFKSHRPIRDAHVSLAALGLNLTVNFSCLPYLMSFAKAWPWVVARVYRTKASKIRPKKRASRVCCSPTAGARCQEAPLACRPHSLAPSECGRPTRPIRLDAALAVGLQQSRRRACHRRRPGGGDGV